MVSGVAISVGRTGGRQWELGPEKTGYLFDTASNALAIMVGHGHTAITTVQNTYALFIFIFWWYLSRFMVYEVWLLSLEYGLVLYCLA